VISLTKKFHDAYGVIFVKSVLQVPDDGSDEPKLLARYCKILLKCCVSRWTSFAFQLLLTQWEKS